MSTLNLSQSLAFMRNLYMILSKRGKKKVIWMLRIKKALTLKSNKLTKLKYNLQKQLKRVYSDFKRCKFANKVW